MLAVDADKCIGCRVCEIICSIEHGGAINPKQSRIRYVDDWPRIGRLAFCGQCREHPCVGACPSGAISVGTGGIIEINASLCSGCGECGQACIHGSLPTDGEYPLFCDTCGGTYPCVRWCPRKAIREVGERRQ